MSKIKKEDIEQIRLLSMKIQTTSIQLAEKMIEMIRILKDFEEVTVIDYDKLRNLYLKVEANKIFISAKLDELSEFFVENNTFTQVRINFDKWSDSFDELIKKKGIKNFFDSNKFTK